jgi:hypothetical protein
MSEPAAPALPGTLAGILHALTGEPADPAHRAALADWLQDHPQDAPSVVRHLADRMAGVECDAATLLHDYFALQEKIHDHFGYREDWRVIPLADHTADSWMLSERSDGGGWVVWSPEPLTAESVRAGEHIYSAVIYTQRHLPRWVYRAPDCTLVCIDPRTDLNHFLAVFDNGKQCHDRTLVALWAERWGDVT